MEQQAIEAALEGNWKKAIKINKQILSENVQDIDALGRLAYAYAKNNDYKKACVIYRKLLKIDPANPIALKNFAKYKMAKACKTDKTNINEINCRISPSLFLSESTKAKSVHLINIAAKDVLQNLLIGEEVKVQQKRYDLQVKDQNGTYLGTFPDDVGRHLIRIAAKNQKVQFFLKDIAEKRLTIFVKWE